MDGILSEVKVLELTHAPSGAFCAKLLADQGADTIKVEPPGSGDPERHEPPFIDGEPHPDRSTAVHAFGAPDTGRQPNVRARSTREPSVPTTGNATG